MITTETHDHLSIPQNNLLDGREYETVALMLLPDELREGDVISNGSGVYQVDSVGQWSAAAGEYVRHVRIKHTLAGPVMGGLVRGTEYIQVLARRRTTEESR